MFLDNDNFFWGIWVFLYGIPKEIILDIFKKKELTQREKSIKYLKKQARKQNSWF